MLTRRRSLMNVASPATTLLAAVVLSSPSVAGGRHEQGGPAAGAAVTPDRSAEAPAGRGQAGAGPDSRLPVGADAEVAAEPEPDGASGGSPAGLRERWEQRYGVRIEFGVTGVYQAADSSPANSPNDWGTVSYDLIGEWTWLNDERLGRHTVGLLVEGGEILGRDDGFDLNQSIGVLSGVNDDADGQEIALTELWTEHTWTSDTIADERSEASTRTPVWTLTLGKLDPTVYFDANRLANDETTQFLATPLVNNPAIAFPDNGLGVHLAFQPHPRWTLRGGVFDARADARETGLSTFDPDHLFMIAELGFEMNLFDQPGEARLLFWRREDPDVDDTGWAISVDQALVQDTLVAFMRVGHAGGELTGVDWHVQAGLGVEAPFGRERDLVALGWSMNRFKAFTPTGSMTPRDVDEQLIEIFYRMQAHERLQLTPFVQTILNPADAPMRSAVDLVGLRAQLAF